MRPCPADHGQARLQAEKQAQLKFWCGIFRRSSFLLGFLVCLDERAAAKSENVGTSFFKQQFASVAECPSKVSVTLIVWLLSKLLGNCSYNIFRSVTGAEKYSYRENRPIWQGVRNYKKYIAVVASVTSEESHRISSAVLPATRLNDALKFCRGHTSGDPKYIDLIFGKAWCDHQNERNRSNEQFKFHG